MKKLFTILLFLLSFVGFSQSGDGYVNYTSYRTQCNNGCYFSRTVDGTSVLVYQHMSNTAEFDAAMTVISSSNEVSVLNSGETQAFSAGGFGSSVTSYDGGRPIGPGNSQGEYYIVDYTGWFYASSTGNYKFHTWSDDSHEFWLDLDGDDVLESTEMITKLYGGSGSNQSTNISLTSGTWYKLRVRFHEYTGGDWMRIQYQDPTNNGSTTWRILGDTTWGDKVSNAQPAPTFTNTVSDGQNVVYYKVFSINGGDGTVGSHHPNNSSEFDVLFDTSTAGTEWTHQGRDTATKALSWPWPNTLPRPNSGVWFGWEITGYFIPEETGNYEFKISSDDRSDFYLDFDDDGTFEAGTSEQVVYYYEGPSQYEHSVSLTKDTPVKFRVRYENGNGGANLYLKWTKPSDTVDNHTFNSDEIWSVKPEDVPLHYDVNYKFRNIDETNFSVNTYYEVSSSEIAQNSNSSAITLDGNGEATISSQVDETLYSSGGKKFRAIPDEGGIAAVLGSNQYGTGNLRFYIDKRMFDDGFDFGSITSVEILDIYSGPMEFQNTDPSSIWQFYKIEGLTLTRDIVSQSEYYLPNGYAPTGIYEMNPQNNYQYPDFVVTNNWAVEDATSFRKQYVVFDSPSTTELETLIDDVFTIADVVMAFNELAGGGINGGLKGDFDYNVQYANADVSRDGVFDFKDTQIMLDFLNGGTMFDASYLAAVMSLTELSEYESMTSTNWTNYGTTRTQFPLGLVTGTKQYDKSIAVHWKGDVNMSHSHLPSNIQVTSMAMKSMNISNSPQPTSKSENTIEVDLDIQKIGEEIVVTLNLPQNSKEIVGTEFRIGYDNSRVTFDRIENGSDLQSFSAKRSTYIKLGSISSDGSQNLNGGTEYKIYFKETNNLTSFLGLVSVLKSELVKKDGTQIGVIVK